MDVQCGCLFHDEEEKENKESETRMGIYMEQKLSLWTIVLIKVIFLMYLHKINPPREG